MRAGVWASAVLAAVAWAGAVLLAQQGGGARGGGPAPAGGGGQGRGGFVAYPQRPPGDPAAIERGKTLWGVNCTFCHGADARGGDGGGPNLLRSTIVLEDQRGEGIGPIVQKGRGTMPPVALTTEQVADVAAFLHSFPVASRTGASTLNIVVGDPGRGAAYVAQKCSLCHTTNMLAAFANKVAEPRVLQQMWLMPGSGGRGGGANAAPVAAPPVTAQITLPSGERLEGEIERIDDFTVTVVAGDGRRTVRTAGTAVKVEILDPLKPHRDLLPHYADGDIHDVTAYLMSLRITR